MKRKLISIALLTGLISPVIVTLCWFNYQKSIIRHEVKWKMIKGINKDELVLLKFTEEQADSAVKWKHSREFEYENQMYDIVESQILGDTTFYWCWWDYEETTLNKRLTNFLADILNNDPQRKDHHDRIFRFFKNLFVIIPSFSDPVDYIRTQTLWHGILNYYNSICSCPPTPPPKLARPYITNFFL